MFDIGVQQLGDYVLEKPVSIVHVTLFVFCLYMRNHIDNVLMKLGLGQRRWRGGRRRGRRAET